MGSRLGGRAGGRAHGLYTLLVALAALVTIVIYRDPVAWFVALGVLTAAYWISLAMVRRRDGQP